MTTNIHAQAEYAERAARSAHEASTPRLSSHTIRTLARRRKARRAYKKARSTYMGFIVSHHDWSDDPRMAEALAAVREAWFAYESADVAVAMSSAYESADWTHKP